MKTVAYGAIFDNLLGLSARSLRTKIVLYGLIYDQLTVSDSWLLSNTSLHQLLKQSDGVEWLRAGVIQPMLRSDMPKLELRRQHHAEKEGSLHGFINDPLLTALVDQNSSPLIYEPKDVGANYRRLADRLMQSDALKANGLSDQSVEQVLSRFAQGAAKGERTDTNTFVKDEVCPLLSSEQAEKLMELARAPYSLNLPTLYGQGIVAPSEFRGHEILRSLFGAGRAVGQLLIEEGCIGDYKLVINERLVSWLLSSDTLESITASELAELRAHPDRVEAQLSLAAYLGVPSELNWQMLSVSLERYLRNAANELFKSRLRRGQVDGDPVASDQLEVTAQGHQVVVGADQKVPMELADMPQNKQGEPESVKIVGRSAMLPEVPTK